MRFYLLILPAAFAISCTSQSQVEKAVDAYMKEKGDQLITDAVNRLVRKQEALSQEDVKNKLKLKVNVTTDGAPSRGPKDAPIKMVAFMDFECPFSKDSLPKIEQILQAYPGRIELFFRNNPQAYRKYARSAHRAALAAHRQNHFWEFHKILYDHQYDLSEKNYRKWASEMGLDMKRFEADYKDPKIDAQIEKDIEFARANGAANTPSFYLNGVLIVGNQAFFEFRDVIDELLKPAEK